MTIFAHQQQSNPLLPWSICPDSIHQTRYATNGQSENTEIGPQRTHYLLCAVVAMASENWTICLLATAVSACPFLVSPGRVSPETSGYMAPARKWWLRSQQAQMPRHCTGRHLGRRWPMRLCRVHGLRHPLPSPWYEAASSGASWTLVVPIQRQ